MDDVADLFIVSAPALMCNSTPFSRQSAAKKPAPEINERGGFFDPTGAAKARLHPKIMSRPAAVRRHAVCSASARVNIVKKIKDIIESDAIVTWLDLIMGHQYGPRGF
ncbi:hypothetical protein [Bradyrhizobium sp. CCBAU 11357]|uniref:hypothetical protein n=1 Tax=Bradyrhizobium sp. CCBAU 11357 TaxID=1630808 RepID=UPI002304617F|nr:hypothetical protein [Bradyrhizobium sp. CCBAU 11357]MDA9500781.1 hypothetical protein [Bradyrhizobium sp. CCBAU 11357]